LDIADEFIDSVTNFGCRLAKHCGCDTLEVRDLQLPLGAWLVPPPRLLKLHGLHTADAGHNYNIRIPSFASDTMPITLSQAGAAPTIQSSQSTKKGALGTQNSFRVHHLARVAQAK